MENEDYDVLIKAIQVWSYDIAHLLEESASLLLLLMLLVVVVVCSRGVRLLLVWMLSLL